MVIVIVRWYIKESKEQTFKDLWINEMEPMVKDGLFREFFSKPIDSSNEKYHTLDFESRHYTTFVNVGIWRELNDFDLAIGNLIPNREKHLTKNDKEIIEVFDFEFKLRERIVMEVEADRVGEWILPPPAV